MDMHFSQSWWRRCRNSTSRRHWTDCETLGQTLRMEVSSRRGAGRRLTAPGGAAPPPRG